MKRILFGFFFSSSQSKGKYEVATGVLKSPDELVDMYQTLISKYPAVVALIDPFRREVTYKHRSFFYQHVQIHIFNILFILVNY